MSTSPLVSATKKWRVPPIYLIATPSTWTPDQMPLTSQAALPVTGSRDR